MASCHQPAGRIVGANALTMQSFAIALGELPPRYFIDHIRFEIDTIVNATQIADFVITADSAGNAPLSARVQNTNIIIGQTSIRNGGCIFPGQLVWTYRQVYVWVQVDVGTCNITALASWRPVPFGSRECDV